MDLSKLPRLSETDKHAPPPSANPAPASGYDAPPQVQADQPPVYQSGAPPMLGSGAEIWFSIAIGALVLLMFPRFLQWCSSRVFGTHFNEFVLDGNIVAYTHVPEFWMDLGPTLFGIVLVLEGVAMLLVRRRAVVMAAFCLTVAATAYNIVYVAVTYSTYGLAVISALAGVFGVFIAMQQWTTLKMSRPPRYGA